MSVLKGEGKVPILFGSTTIVVGSRGHRGYLARPDLAGEWPTVVVVPSAWGVVPSVKDLCRRLARRALAVVAVDPYQGSPPPRSADDVAAAAALAAVPAARARRAVGDVVEFVRNPAGFWSSAEHGWGILGIGGGGPRAVATAVEEQAAALALCYTPLDPPTTEAVARYPGSVLGIFGRNDERVPVAGVLAARNAMPHAELVIYDDVGHDFLDDNRATYDGEVAADAVERLAAFFEKHLPPAPA